MLWIFLMILCALFFSLNHITNKAILRDAGAFDTVIASSILQILFILPFIGKVDFSISLKTLLLIAFAFSFGFGGYLMLNKCYKDNEVSTAAPLLNLNPVLIIIVSYILLGESLNMMQMVAVALIILGGYMISLKRTTDFLRPFTSMPAKGFLQIGAVIFLWSFPAVLVKIILRSTDFLTLAFFVYSGVFIFSSSWLLSKKRSFRIRSLFKQSWPLLGLSAFFLVAADILQFYVTAMPAVMVSLLMPIKRVSSLFTVILGGRIFKENNIMGKLIASLIMIAGLFMIGFFSV